MSISSVGSSNPYSYLQWPLQPDSTDPNAAAAPSDPLQSLYQAFTGGSASDPLLAAIGADSGLASSSGAPQFSPDAMQQLLSAQGDQGSSPLQSLFAKFDANGDGQISQSEFENAIGPNADQSKVDALFSKLDTNGDGTVSQDELQSAMQKAHGGGGHHHHHHMEAQGSGQPQGSDPLQSLLSGTAADGTTSQTSSNSDGSTTTTITYADGTKIDMTTPAASDVAANGTPSDPNALNFGNMLKQLIALQAQLAAPTMNLSV